MTYLVFPTRRAYELAVTVLADLGCILDAEEALREAALYECESRYVASYLVASKYPMIAHVVPLADALAEIAEARRTAPTPKDPQRYARHPRHERTER